MRKSNNSDSLTASDFRLLAGRSWPLVPVGIAASVANYVWQFDPSGWIHMLLGLGVAMTIYCEAMAWLCEHPA